jgi:hypothetical protein
MGAGVFPMLEWMFLISLALAAFFFLFAHYSDIPAFYALAGVILLFTSWQITSDGGIWRETVKHIDVGDTNYTITQTYDTNSTISTTIATNPLGWLLNTCFFFMGLLFVAYSIGEGIKKLRI